MTGPVERVRAALLVAGHVDTIVAFPDGTRTAADAAAAIGCGVADIAKSIVFAVPGASAGAGAAVVVASGVNRVDRRRAGAALGLRLVVADAGFVLEATGFAAGGLAPLGLPPGTPMLLDEDLFALEVVWAAAGSPRHVFRTTAAELARMTGAAVAAVRAG